MPKSMHVSGDIVVWLNLLTHIDTPTHSLILKAAQQAADVGADANADVEVCQPGRSIALKSTLQTHLVQGSERNSSTNSKIYTYLPGYFLSLRRKFHCIILLTTQTHTHTHLDSTRWMLNNLCIPIPRQRHLARIVDNLPVALWQFAFWFGLPNFYLSD